MYTTRLGDEPGNCQRDRLHRRPRSCLCRRGGGAVSCELHGGRLNFLGQQRHHISLGLRLESCQLLRNSGRSTCELLSSPAVVLSTRLQLLPNRRIITNCNAVFNNATVVCPAGALWSFLAGAGTCASCPVGKYDIGASFAAGTAAAGQCVACVASSALGCSGSSVVAVPFG
jgi:hypothetical protein